MGANDIPRPGTGSRVAGPFRPPSQPSPAGGGRRFRPPSQPSPAGGGRRFRPPPSLPPQAGGGVRRGKRGWCSAPSPVYGGGLGWGQLIPGAHRQTTHRWHFPCPIPASLRRRGEAFSPPSQPSPASGGRSPVRRRGGVRCGAGEKCGAASGTRSDGVAGGERNAAAQAVGGAGCRKQVDEPAPAGVRNATKATEGKAAGW